MRWGRADGFLYPEEMEAAKEGIGSFSRKFLAEKEKSLNNFGWFQASGTERAELWAHGLDSPERKFN
jgi:hypothetical protein